LEMLGTDLGWGAEQFRIWGQPRLASGNDILFYSPKDPEVEKKLKKRFRKVIVLPAMSFYTFEHNSEGLRAYYCRDLK